MPLAVEWIPMHILFIGGTGLISTAIVGKLLGRGAKVTCFNRGKSESRLPEHPNLEIVTGDRQDRPAFEAAFEGRTFDAVIDMISFHPDDAASAIRAFSGKTKQFVHCSTVCVYSGPPETIPTPETEPYHSIGGYGKNKAAIEELLLAEHGKNGFPVTILRPSHSYGEGGNILRPWGPWDGWGRFIDRLRKGKPVIVPGDGTNLWASCHVEDVAEGFIAVLGKPEAIGQCFNITGEQNMTWNTYHEQVAEVVGGTFHPVYIPTDVLCEGRAELVGRPERDLRVSVDLRCPPRSKPSAIPARRSRSGKVRPGRSPGWRKTADSPTNRAMAATKIGSLRPGARESIRFLTQSSLYFGCIPGGGMIEYSARRGVAQFGSALRWG